MSDTIFMIHGMWGGAWYWQNYKEFFEKQGYRCKAATLRHHAMEPTAEPPMELGRTGLLDYAADLEKEIRALDEKPVLMGHSMGGLLTQILAARGLAKAIVLLAPASPRGILAIHPSVIKSFWSMIISGRFWTRPYRQTFDEAVYSMLHLMPAAMQREIYARFVYESGRAAGEIGFWIFDGQKASAVDARKVQCPVLVISGKQDRITPAAVHRQIAKKYKADLKVFENHAHWLVMEPGWEDVAGYAAEWLKRNPA